MRTVFDCETQVGEYAYEPESGLGFTYAEPDFATLYAHTTARVSRSCQLMRIEQECFLRKGKTLPAPSWAKPVVITEPLRDNPEEIEALAKALHEQLIERLRARVQRAYA
jgi:hypothetical protein